VRRPDPLPPQYRRLLARAAVARRVRRAAVALTDLSPQRLASIEMDAIAYFANLPFRARLANRFADALFAMDEALSMCSTERSECQNVSWIEPQIRRTYEHVNALMEAVSD